LWKVKKDLNWYLSSMEAWESVMQKEGAGLDAERVLKDSFAPCLSASSASWDSWVGGGGGYSMYLSQQRSFT
jgi:hypothetical protein